MKTPYKTWQHCCEDLTEMLSGELMLSNSDYILFKISDWKTFIVTYFSDFIEVVPKAMLEGLPIPYLWMNNINVTFLRANIDGVQHRAVRLEQEVDKGVIKSSTDSFFTHELPSPN